MSNDISSMYTKQCNSQMGRKGYSLWKREKETNIPPQNYGMYLSSRKRGQRK